ncbi:MAG: PDZ domain-containing protein [Magnetococcus sp. YQC-5]
MKKSTFFRSSAQGQQDSMDCYGGDLTMKSFNKPIFSILTALLASNAVPVEAGGWLGITVQPPEGVQIGEILKDGPADKAGLQKKDILLKIDGKVITSMDHFLNSVATATPGKEIVLNLIRKGEEREFKITPDDSQNHPSVFPDGRPMGTAEMPKGKVWHRSEQPWQGNAMSAPMEAGQPDSLPSRMPNHSMQGMPQNDGYATPPEPPEPAPKAWLGIAPELTPTGGVAVTRIAPNGPGERAGMQIGDMIVSLNGQSVSSPRAMSRILRGFLPGDLVEVTINRNGQMIDVQAKLAAPPAEMPQ